MTSPFPNGNPVAGFYGFPSPLTNGVTREAIGEMITHLAFSAGWPAAMSAPKMATQLLDDRKESTR